MTLIVGKSKFVPVLNYHAMKTYWGGGGIVPRILNLRVGDQLHAPASLPPGNETPVPTVRESGWLK
jgi:hypothetical protein